ncbi:hypothetical protein [Streptomyces sp. NPDC051218]
MSASLRRAQCTAVGYGPGKGRTRYVGPKAEVTAAEPPARD